MKKELKVQGQKNLVKLRNQNCILPKIHMYRRKIKEKKNIFVKFCRAMCLCHIRSLLSFGLILMLSYKFVRLTICTCRVTTMLRVRCGKPLIRILSNHIFIEQYYTKEFEFGKDECKTHVLHHLIRDCHINFLLKTQYILPRIITSR